MVEDEYYNYDSQRTVLSAPHNRREFLQRVGGGILIIFTMAESAEAQRRRSGRDYPQDFNAYLRIGEDGRVTCFSGKIEMGQGIITSLAQELAEELDVALETVDMVMGDTSVCPYDRGTYGSRTTRFFGPAVRAAGAEARAVLIELAAEHLGVSMDRLQVKNGTVFDKAQNDRRVTYGELAKGKTIERRARQDVSPKTPSQFQVIGKPTNRTDAVEKVTGKAKFAGDIRLPGMLYARILRPPVHGAKLKSIDVSTVEKRKDVLLVRDGDLIAVLHDKPDEAENALAQIRAEFDVPEAHVDDESIFDYLVDHAAEGDVADRGGDITAGKKLASFTIKETYLNSYVAHAPIEPHTALAIVEGKKAKVWASTQAPFRLHDEIADVLDLPSQNVRVITPFVGGGFGGKTRNLQAIEAARLAKLIQRPVQVAWTREEEFFNDTFRPAAVVKIRSGVSESGKIVFWDNGVYFAGERGSELFYNVPHHRTVTYGEWRGDDSPHPFATGAWRAPGNNTNTFARESQIDIMASKAGTDPVEFRLKNLSDQRMVRVLKAAAEKFEWAPSSAPSGRGVGVACGIDSGTYVATMAEVDVDNGTGEVLVKRVVCAQDMGLVINPEGAKLQMEGCITMGLGYALTEEVHFKGGQVFDLDFNTYELPRFSWVPKIETVLIKAEDTPPQGGGEPAIICMGAVIANAIHDATGARLFQLPMTGDRVEAAMAMRDG